jgi:hypothetical protein
MATPAVVAKQIKRDLQIALKFYEASLNETVAQDIGFTIIGQMLDLISKGISPIAGQGRFPAYKWAAFRNDLKKQKSSIASALKKNKKAFIRLGRKNERQLLMAAKEANRKGVSSTSGKYPFTKFAISQGKKPRPVNLLLTGEFLFHLEAVVTGVAGKHGLEIGFFDAKQAAKETGHREGANGQPQRPIIPLAREDFVASITNAIYKKIEEALDRTNALGSSSP